MASSNHDPAEPDARKQPTHVRGMIHGAAEQQIHRHCITHPRHGQTLPLGVSLRITQTNRRSEQAEHTAADAARQWIRRVDDLAQHEPDDASAQKHENETRGANRLLQALAEGVQGEHIEADVQQAKMNEHRGEVAPGLGQAQGAGERTPAQRLRAPNRAQ